MKKMTCKEFKEILNDAGMHFEIWQWEGILNGIIMLNRYNAEHLRKNNLYAAAEGCDETAQIMHDALAARGYYNE